MTQVTVQCKGSGKQISAGSWAKRGQCPNCGRMQDLRPDGKIRKHTIFTKTRKLK